MKIRQFVVILAMLAQSFAAVSQAATVVVPAGGAMPLQGLNAALLPQLQAGTAKLTWANGQADPNTPANPEEMSGSSLDGSNLIKAQDSGTGHYEAYAINDLGETIRVVESDEYPSQSLALDDATGQFQQLQLTGASKKIIGKISATVTGGTLNASNVRIDLVNGSLVMDLSCQRLPAGTTTYPPGTALNMAVYTFLPANVTGPQRLSPQDLLLSAANRNAALQAQGYTLGPNGALQSVLLMKDLQLTNVARDFIVSNCFGFLATGQDGLNAINSSTYGWGQLQVTTNVALREGPAAADMVLGQAASTPFNLPNGVPLRIRPLSFVSGSSIFPLSYDAAAPVLSELGLSSWFNALLVYPDSASGLPGLTSTVSLLRDPRFGPSDGDGWFQSNRSIKSAGSTAKFLPETGQITALGGFNQAWRAEFMPGVMGGGRWRAQNINYQFNTKAVLADLVGETAVIGGGGAVTQPIEAQPATAVWAFAGMSGPVTIPLPALSGAASVSALPAVLQNAGFTVTSVSTSAIDFKGTYVFSDLKAMPVYKDYICRALACTPLAKRALTAMDTDFIGNFTAIVTFRLPLVP